METPLPNDSYQASIKPPVGGRLRSFRRDWHANNCSANVLNIITNVYVLPFLSRPNLIRFPLIVSEYKAPQKDQALADCIQSLLLKNAIERVENVKSLGFYSRLFLVPKPHQRWRPVIDLSRLNTFLHVEKFKMETPESIRTSLIPGEWVASIDLSDAYLHMPIHPNSRKYLRFPQLRVPQLPAAPQPPRLVSRSGQLQEQGFSVEVAERIAAPQRSSTRNIYKSKWALFEKWCRDISVDFSSPSVKQISDFFMYLYQDLNRRPSTIDGYRTAIVDTLGPTAQHIAHNEDLHRLLSSFHRDRPKSSRNLPQWNLSVVLNELTKAPFEPMKDTDLKHLTLKTAFLLALASGKRRSEIHAWVANKVSNLGQWEKVALFPSSDFIAKNQLAREGSQSVSPVTIPALTTIVDRQFKEDRTLCPVRALRYYLDRTKDLRGSRSLLFISFKKGHTSDIRPATLSSWLKQTILLCYKQADQQALDLVQVKAHDIRAFAASKAFYGGVSVDQIMQACHWKAHNTFTNFYLKDLTWSDNDNNMYLGPVVAAQQVLDPSPQ